MMTKVVSAGDYDFSEQIISLVKIARAGFMGSDKKAFEKRAGSELLASLNEVKAMLKRGEELAHLYAFGSTEKFGPNRNGDGFREQICREYHDTFPKHARWYRDHKNRDERKSYGRVLKSAFNEPMGRVELMVALYGTKEAADRHQAYVADLEMDDLAKGNDIPVSMACSVSRDFCSYCKNAAPRAADYCRGTDEGGRCKAGGLKNRMGALVEVDGDLHHLHADNPDPRFFDISRVFRPADRIAYVTGSLQKAAGYHGVVKSADLARILGVTVPARVLVSPSTPPKVARAIKLAYQLADIESDIERGIYPISAMSAPAVCTAMQCSGEFSLPPGGREKFASAMRAMADARICLPLPYFVEYVTGENRDKSAEIAAVVAQDLPGAFSRLVADGDLAEQLANSPYAAAPHTAAPAYSYWAAKHAADLSMTIDRVQHRAALASIREVSSTFRKNASCSEAAAARPGARFAREYALYKLAFLSEIPESAPDFALTASLVVLQNHVA